MDATLPTAPALPEPALPRWQPLRLGLVELFHYDSEEFWFRDGHLLLRGNNGTGKSKVLSLTLPLLLDAQLKPSRVEPDGDAGKKMAWNLLLGKHDRRMGYTWVEFGRIDDDGQPRYLTLGCGLSAVAARTQVESWSFLLERGRIGQDLWLVSQSRVVLTRERLREALQARAGQVFDTATAYRRAVDERLYHLGEVRYAALMDTLIQLRQPQLSKRPDEGSLSNALTQALPPMSSELLADVADALSQLEENRRELEEYAALARAVDQFNVRYRRYAATQARRQAAALRSAQSGYDGASRELNQDLAALDQARSAEAAAQQAAQQAEAVLAADRARVDTLQSDPAMTSARQLDQAARDAQQHRQEAERADAAARDLQARLERERQSTRERAARADRAADALGTARKDAGRCAAGAGLAAAFRDNPLATGGVATLAAPRLDAAMQDLRRAAATRREQLALLRRRCDAAERAAEAHASAQSQRDERRDEADGAAARRSEADAAIGREAQALGDAWQQHFDGLRQLHVAGVAAVLENLAAWTTGPAAENPAHHALLAAHQAAIRALAAGEAGLRARLQTLVDEASTLQDEQAQLERGGDLVPAPPAWRDAQAREAQAGAPLWQLVDFAPDIPPDARGGIEAALAAAGLLDAWVTPDGALRQADGEPLHDSQWLQRSPHTASLAAWLRPAEASATPPVASDVVARLLQGVACSVEDDGAAEAWVSPDGRFRLGALAGAWRKPDAELIGYAARAAARARRLQEIAARLGELAAAQAGLQQQLARNAGDQRQADAELQSAPLEDALRAAHAEAGAAARAFEAARQRLDTAEKQLQAAAARRDAAREALARDAADVGLPATRDALDTVDATLHELAAALPALAAAASAHRDAAHELARQRQREQEAGTDAEAAATHADERGRQAAETATRLATLRESVGAEVEEILARLATARTALGRSEIARKQQDDALRRAGETRARAEQKAEDARTRLAERAATRTAAIARLQGFAATGLLLAAWPDAEVPPLDAPWTIDPALSLARRTERALTDVKDDDETWSRVQNQVSQDYTELNRALAALSHQAQAETSDYGLVVSIIYQNRPERPDQLALHLADEIAQRRELLTAREREVLENHLQAEIASTVQKLMHGAERQINAINTELAKRPTSTGVRFRLLWQPLPEGADGAPVGLEAARRRLLNTSADLWTPEDRRVVGRMLQQRIADERSRADTDPGGSLLEQLARALDYRRWHRFRVQRWQDGQWRPLTGPASSGERALGLTVPLFAAVSSYYSQADAVHAPRLVLLDEAFAGIDDAARAHCMALIREFDLDFVITSEREWACYAELPGVAIAHLQRREGIDAVHVSRWTWDGRARRREADPDRRFPPPA